EAVFPLSQAECIAKRDEEEKLSRWHLTLSESHAESPCLRGPCGQCPKGYQKREVVRETMLTVSQLAPLKDRDPYLYETLAKIVSAVNAPSQRSGVDPATPSPAPSPIASINVQASNGWFDLAITDPSDSRPGLFYFAESDTSPAFGAPRVYFLGASRNLYVQL